MQDEIKPTNKMLEVAQQQYAVGVNYRTPRLTKVQEAEDQYNLKDTALLKGRFNVPLPILSGFVDSLKAKIDDKPNIEFEGVELADYRIAKKISSAFRFESTRVDKKWALKDRIAKTNAIFCGRGAYEYQAIRKPDYESIFNVIDTPYDLIVEPHGGCYLENHYFYGVDNQYFTKFDLEQGVKSGLYDKEETAKLIKSLSAGESKENSEGATGKVNKMRAVGLDPNTNSFVGQDVFNLCKWFMTWEGQRWYLLFDPKTGIAVRKIPLKGMFKSELWPLVTWSTHEDGYNFWNKATVDDIVPIGELIRVVINQALDNLQKRNWPQKAVDPDIFPNLDELDWQPDGLIVADTKMGERAIQNGIYKFETPDNTNITVNLVEYFDRLLAQKTGISPASQGVSDKDAKVGVYYGDLAQTADRFGLLNKSYSEAYSEIGLRYFHGLRENMSQKMMVKIVGSRGVSWDNLLKEELENVEPFKNINISITGGNAEAQADEIKKKKRSEALDRITANPNLAQQLNPKVLIEEILRNGDYEEETIVRLTDLDSEGDMDSISEAEYENQRMIEGKDVKPNRSATTAHVRHHIDFVTEDAEHLNDEIIVAIMSHSKAEIQIAAANAKEKAARIMSQGRAKRPEEEKEETPLNENMPAGTVPGSAQRSQEMAQSVAPTL